MAEMVEEWGALPWFGFKLFLVVLVPSLVLFWPGFARFGDAISSYLAETNTKRAPPRAYQQNIVSTEAELVGRRGNRRPMLFDDEDEDNDDDEDNAGGVAPRTAVKAVHGKADAASHRPEWRRSTSATTSTDKGVQTLTDTSSAPLSVWADWRAAPSPLDGARRPPLPSSSSLTRPSNLAVANADHSAGGGGARSRPLIARSASVSDANDSGGLAAAMHLRTGIGGVAAASSPSSPGDCSDDDVVDALLRGELALHALESRLGDSARAVRLRRRFLSQHRGVPVHDVSFESYEYDRVLGACCELVVGYVPLPLGVIGPLKVDGVAMYVPLATTEGTLVASTNRGCKALSASAEGVETFVTADGITRAPCVQLPSVRRAVELKAWLEHPSHRARVEESFNASSRFGHLSGVSVAQAGRLLYVRLCCFSGDAMGMNMVSKGTERVLALLAGVFPDMEVVSLSGNYCTDKKAAAVNWIQGRGKSVVASALVRGEVVRRVLKTSVARLVEVNLKKNLVGSAMAGSIGGFNAHAANLVAALFLATGQDPAQVVESANCITLLEAANGGEDLRMSVTMPSIEVGTVGGGTQLPSQSGCLDMLGVRGAGAVPGEHSRRLARVVAATVMCGELSLLAALSAGHLVSAHMRHNRSSASLPTEHDAAAATAAAAAVQPVAAVDCAASTNLER